MQSMIEIVINLRSNFQQIYIELIEASFGLWFVVLSVGERQSVLRLVLRSVLLWLNWRSVIWSHMKSSDSQWTEIWA